jgi:hypothetical protein
VDAGIIGVYKGMKGTGYFCAACEVIEGWNRVCQLAVFPGIAKDVALTAAARRAFRRPMTGDGWLFRRSSATTAHDARRRRARGGGRRAAGGESNVPWRSSAFTRGCGVSRARQQQPSVFDIVGCRG